MKKRIFIVISIFVLISILNCSSKQVKKVNLTKAGSRVGYSSKKTAPANCKATGEILKVEKNENLQSLDDVITALRNKTAKAGGNFFLIENYRMLMLFGKEGSDFAHIADGRVFICK